MISAVALRAGLSRGEETSSEGGGEKSTGILLKGFCLKKHIYIFIFICAIRAVAKGSPLPINPQQLMCVFRETYWQLSSSEINLAGRNLSVPLWNRLSFLSTLG